MKAACLAFLILFCAGTLHARPGQFVLRSGSAEDPDFESPLSEQAKKYAGLLSFSNALMDSVMSGKEAALYDTKFSPLLRESMDRAWFLAQFKNVRVLHGNPTSYKKKQWYFIEETIQGKPLVHSVKFVHHGSVVVQYVITVPASAPGRVIGFQVIAPQDPAEQEETPAWSSGSEIEEDQEKPLEGGALKYAVLLKTANAFIEQLKAEKFAAAYGSFSETLKAQVSLQGLEDAQKRTTQFAGPIESFKPGQWMFFVKKYQNSEVVVLRKVVRHANGVMHYNFPVLSTEQAKFIGFQSHMKPGPVQQRFYYTDKDGNKVEVK